MLYDFSSTDERGAADSLVLGDDGNFYGIEGGHDGSLAFRITPAGKLSEIHNFFSPKIEGLASDLMLGKDGEFYAVANDPDVPGGGCEADGGCDSIFRLDKNGSLTALYSFDSPNPPAPLDDRQPDADAGLTENRDGNIYGVADRKSAPYSSVIFELTPKGRLLALAATEQCKFPPYVSPLL